MGLMTVENESPFTNILQTSRSQIPSILSDFRKYYVMYHKNPEVDEFKNFFFESKQQLSTLNNSLFSIQTELETNIQKMETEMRNISEKIDKEKLRYGNAFTRQSQLTNANDGAEQLISDSQQLYNIQYMKNVELLVGVFFLLGLVIKSVRANR
ncbi:hypothetical protein N9K75_02900 [bacterium]|nr:hypothetical protein [bacterium]